MDSTDAAPKPAEVSIPAPLLGVRCPCGLEIVGRGDDEVVARVNVHLNELHSRVAGRYGDDDIVAMAYRKPV